MYPTAVTNLRASSGFILFVDVEACDREGHGLFCEAAGQHRQPAQGLGHRLSHGDLILSHAQTHRLSHPTPGGQEGQ